MIDALFGSKTRVKLLNLFLNNPGRAFYVREITREVSEQINSVRRELANLVNVGIVRADSSENKLYYEVDTTQKFYEPLRAMFSNDAAVADDTKVSSSGWAKKFHAVGDVRVVIFAGKLVHGSDSALDVMVAGDNISPIKLKNLIKALEREAGGSLAFSSLAFNDFYYRLSVKDKFVADILATKHTIVLDDTNVLAEENVVDNTTKASK